MKAFPNYTVWVLGAGFSRSLDGPLLQDFFSTTLRPRVYRLVERLGGALPRADLDVLERAYWGGDAGASGQIPVGQPWRDPEEFLAWLDTAYADPQSREAGVMKEAGHDSRRVEMLRSMARRYIAIATDEFVAEDWRPLQRVERWRPYFDWARRVRDRTDVVITFNYDRVVESASAGMIEPRLPSDRGGNRPWLLKLHGSVNWRQGTNGVIGEHEKSGIALVNDSHDPVIGVPGPSKFAATTGDLRSLWVDATECMKLVSRIVFVGFRFPPGDSEARRQLLDAITANENPDLHVHVVLGPTTNDPQIVRVEKLLERALARKHTDAAARVHVEPLYAEDFIALDD